MSIQPTSAERELGPAWRAFTINNPGESRVFKLGGYFGTSRLFFEPLTDWPSLAVSL